MKPEKFYITTKNSFLISSLVTFFLAIFSAYKGILLIFIQKAMEDTFVGGETSDVSIELWLIISGIMLFLTFIFIYIRKIKEFKSQKTIVSGFILLWFITSVVFLFYSTKTIIFSIVPFGLFIINLICYSNIKKQIVYNKKNKPLSETEIHLLQRLAKKK